MKKSGKKILKTGEHVDIQKKEEAPPKKIKQEKPIFVMPKMRKISK